MVAPLPKAGFKQHFDVHSIHSASHNIVATISVQPVIVAQEMRFRLDLVANYACAPTLSRYTSANTV
jgi:hypothetical protein